MEVAYLPVGLLIWNMVMALYIKLSKHHLYSMLFQAKLKVFRYLSAVLWGNKLLGNHSLTSLCISQPRVKTTFFIKIRHDKLLEFESLFSWNYFSEISCF